MNESLKNTLCLAFGAVLLVVVMGVRYYMQRPEPVEVPGELSAQASEPDSTLSEETEVAAESEPEPQATDRETFPVFSSIDAMDAGNSSSGEKNVSSSGMQIEAQVSEPQIIQVQPSAENEPITDPDGSVWTAFY